MDGEVMNEREVNITKIFEDKGVVLKNEHSVLTYSMWNDFVYETAHQLSLTVPVAENGVVTNGLVISGDNDKEKVALKLKGSIRGIGEGGALEIDTPLKLKGSISGIGEGGALEIDTPLKLKGSISGNGSGGALKIETPNGSLEIGCKQKAWCHFNTDQEKYFFNTELRVAGGKIGSYGGDLALCVDGSRKLTIQSNGNTGIGITNPQEKLDVDGNVQCKVLKGKAGSEAKLLTRKLTDNVNGGQGTHDLSFGYEVVKDDNNSAKSSYGYLNIYLDGKLAGSVLIDKGTNIVASGGEG